MLWNDKQVDVQCLRLSEKQGILSRCLLLNELLREACLDENCLDCDPEFYAKQYVALLQFKSTQGECERHESSHVFPC